MKKFKMLFVLAALLVLAQFGYSQGSIALSKHDFSTGTTWNTTGEICIVCHAPHNANTTVLDAPLWNHQLSAVSSYTVYSRSSMNATVGQPDGSSKLCLSCHDGTVALENFGPTTTGTNKMTGPSVLGTSLSNSHPFSITYDAALATADGGLNNPAVALSGLGGTISANLLEGGNKLQCSSCHDVHNGAGVTHLLRKSNSGSALCLTCHKK